MGFAHITLATRDVKATSNFFVKTLGWAPIERPNNIPMAANWLSLGQGQEMHLVEVPDFEPSPFEREYGRHFAVFYRQADFPALKERLKDAGAQLIDPIRPTPMERFFFRDPNGYMFEVVAES